MSKMFERLGKKIKLLIVKIVTIFIKLQNKKELYQKTLKTEVSMTQNP